MSAQSITRWTHPFFLLWTSLCRLFGVDDCDDDVDVTSIIDVVDSSDIWLFIPATDVN